LYEGEKQLLFNRIAAVYVLINVEIRARKKHSCPIYNNCYKKQLSGDNKLCIILKEEYKDVKRGKKNAPT
jgi:hypothetical protein